MAESAPGTEIPAGGVVADSSFYAGAAEALRSACAQIGEASDAAQRAGFFAGIADCQDEALAAAHDADRAAVMAMAEALRAKDTVASYADAARITLDEVKASFSGAARAGQPTGGAGSGEMGSGPKAEEEGGFSGHLAGALEALATERERQGGADDSDGDYGDYAKLAQSLSVLAGGRFAYREVDEAQIRLANARDDYLEESRSAAQTTLAADLTTAVAAAIRVESVGQFRSALTALAVARTAYTAEVADELWGALAEYRTNLAAATAAMLEIQDAVGDIKADGDVDAASALAYSLGDSGSNTGIHDAAHDAVVDFTKHQSGAQSACDAADVLLVENRAVAADALIEAHAAVDGSALAEVKAAYDTVSGAMDALFGARAAFEVGYEFALQGFLGAFQ